MFSRKNRKSAGDETGRIAQDAAPGSERGPSGPAWLFRRIWWSIEKLVVWPIGTLVARAGRIVKSVGAEVAWPFRRAWWSIEKSVVWPVSDRLRGRSGGREVRPAPVRRKMGPAAWVGGTALAMLAAGAVTAAVYFYNEAERERNDATLAEAPAAADTVVVPMIPPAMTEAPPDPTLQGAAPALPGAGKGKGSKGDSLPPEAIRPKPKPKAPALRVAHDFAESFVAFEVGGKAEAKALRTTSTPKLARELGSRPPRLPQRGKVPQATVLNVVEGKKDKDGLEVSVALIRTGSSSELRLGMKKVAGRGWLVSEVKG